MIIIVVVVVGAQNGRVRLLHRSVSLKSNIRGAARTHSKKQTIPEVLFQHITLLTFINTVSMVTPLEQCLLLCDRLICVSFLEGTCFSQSES